MQLVVVATLGCGAAVGATLWQAPQAVSVTPDPIQLGAVWLPAYPAFPVHLPPWQ